MLPLSSPDILDISQRRHLSKWLVERRTSDVKKLEFTNSCLKGLNCLAAIALAWCFASLSLGLLGELSSGKFLQITEMSAEHLIGVSVCLIVLRAALIWGSEYLGAKAARLVCERLQRDCITAILHQDGKAELAAGAASNDFFERIEAIWGFYARYRPAVSSLAIALPLMSVALFLANTFSGLVALFCGLFIPVLSAIAGLRTAKLSMIEFDKLSQMGAYFLDRMRGLLVLRTLGQVSAESDRISAVSHSFRKSALRVLRLAFLPSLTTELVLMGGLVLITTESAKVLLNAQAHSDIGLGEAQHAALFALFLLPDFFLPFRRLSAHYHDRIQAFGAAYGLSRLLQGHSREALPKTTKLQEHKEDVCPVSAPPAIDFEKVGPFYEGSGSTIQPVSFSVSPGTLLVLTGPSGVGKSTVLNVLTGFTQSYSGHVRCNGTLLESRVFQSESWRKSLGWVGQSSYLFHGSVRDNLLLFDSGQQHCTEPPSVQTHLLHKIGLGDLDLDTPVGQGGQLLSGGQGQRLLLARALLRSVPLLLLDEPTAHLDTDTERLCIEAILSLKGKATLIVASHSPALVECADQVVEMSPSLSSQNKGEML